MWMTSTDRFEIKARAFRAMTGHWPPGKDYPSAAGPRDDEADRMVLDNMEPWQKAMLVAWRVRNNCSLCFYKRIYEWVGLYEIHPILFELACKIERDLCHRQEHTWIRGFKLPSLISRAEKIKEHRAKAVVKYLRTKQTRYLFDTNDPIDELAVTSCGLLCGK